MRSRQDLHPYQQKAVEFIKEHRAAALFLQMGLGKSVITLTAISDMLDDVEVSSVLVVAPKKVAESTWAQEVLAWKHLRHIRVSVALGDKRRRMEALARQADIYVTSRDLVAKILQEARIVGRTFDMLVLDELTSFKTYSATRVRAIRKARPFFRRCVGLTGTPTPNGLKDIWTQMYCVDMGASLGRSKTRFMAEYFDMVQHMGITIKCTPKTGAEKKIYKLLEPTVLTMKAEDYLQLPPFIERTIRVQPSEEFMKKYRDFERENVLQFVDETDRQPQTVIAANAAALCNKLCQYANGAIYTEEHDVQWLNNEKLEALAELLETAQASGEHMLLFYQFQHDVERIQRYCDKAGIKAVKYKTDADLREWNKGNIEVLLAHAASTAYGLNLQQGGHVVAWYGTGWNAEYYQQGNARLYRQGQQEPVRVYRLIVAGTMDDKALRAVEGKIMGQEAMLSALKEKTNEYLKQK